MAAPQAPGLVGGRGHSPLVFALSTDGSPRRGSSNTAEFFSIKSVLCFMNFTSMVFLRRLGPPLLSVSRSPTQVLLQVTYLPPASTSMCSNSPGPQPFPLGVGQDAGLLIFLFGVTMEPGLGFPSAEPGFRPLRLLAWLHGVLEARLAGLGCMSPGHRESCPL